MTEAERRRSIITTYAGWTALSALKSGSPIKSRADIYPLLGTVNFGAVLDGSSGAITVKDFADWHRAAVSGIQATRPALVVGWAAKLINVYLKTAAYVGELGRPGLRDLLHPPIDGGLWDGLERWVLARNDSSERALLGKIHVVRQIKLITSYAIYETIIDGCRAVAEKERCRLIEVEQFWEGASAPPAKRPDRT